MSSELSVKAISIVQRSIAQTSIAQPTTQDANTGRGRVEHTDSKVEPLNVTASVESIKGKSLPKTGSDVPAGVFEIDGAKTTKSLSSEEVLEAVQNLNDFVQKTRRELNFSVDEQTGRTVVKVIDHETKDVIRQIPAEEVLDVARRVAEHDEQKGNLFKMEV